MALKKQVKKQPLSRKNEAQQTDIAINTIQKEQYIQLELSKSSYNQLSSICNTKYKDGYELCTTMEAINIDTMQAIIVLLFKLIK